MFNSIKSLALVATLSLIAACTPPVICNDEIFEEADKLSTDVRECPVNTGPMIEPSQGLIPDASSTSSNTTIQTLTSSTPVEYAEPTTVVQVSTNPPASEAPAEVITPDSTDPTPVVVVTTPDPEPEDEGSDGCTNNPNKSRCYSNHAREDAHAATRAANAIKKEQMRSMREARQTCRANGETGCD